MATACELCRRRIEDRDHRVVCECGWSMDTRCEENHRSWCPAGGRDAWVGTLER